MQQTKHQTTKASQAAKQPSRGRLIRCQNMRMRAGRLQVCNEPLGVIEYGKGEIKCPHSKCKAVTAFEFIEPSSY